MPVEQWRDALAQLERQLAPGDQTGVKDMPPLDRLAGFYAHMGDLAKGYEKDRTKLAEALRHIDSWIAEVNRLQAVLAA
jgi:hypothetical protein